MDFATLTSHPLFPRKMARKLEQLKFLRERPDFHPEESANEHIQIVTNRLSKTLDIDLICAGIFHDIHKFDCVEKNPKTGYPTSPGHDKKAGETVRTDENVQTFLKAFGADVESVAWLCEQHMRIKTITGMKKKKQDELKGHPLFQKLIVFTHADDMMKEFVYPLPEDATWRTHLDGAEKEKANNDLKAQI